MYKEGKAWEKITKNKKGTVPGSDADSLKRSLILIMMIMIVIMTMLIVDSLQIQYFLVLLRVFLY